MRNPNPDILVRIAQGDAYCLAYEFIVMHPQHESIMNLQEYHMNPVLKIPAGTSSDDTQMSLAVAEALLNNQDLENPRVWVSHFLDAFKRDPRQVYARSFQTFLEEVQNVEDFISMIKPDSDKNGAAMRSVPLGVIPDVERLKKITKVQASTTHNSPGGKISALMVALMSHYALHRDEPLERVHMFLKQHINEHASPCPLWAPWQGRVKGDNLGIKTALAVMELVRTETTLTGVIKKTLEWGGDTDSVAAIALGILSSRVKSDLPAFFEKDLDRGSKYGVQYLRSVGLRLMDAYKL